jgi:hypothetical protein
MNASTGPGGDDGPDLAVVALVYVENSRSRRTRGLASAASATVAAPERSRVGPAPSAAVSGPPTAVAAGQQAPVGAMDR